MTPDDIRLIHKTHELRGTLYFEFYPGMNQGNDCWSKASVYLPEEVFGLIEPIFECHQRQFSHYAFVNIDRLTWNAIIADLGALAERARLAGAPADLQNWIRFFYKTSKHDFCQNFRPNADALSHMVAELMSWVDEQLELHNTIAVLGI